jgi:hypothetical protein
MFSYTFVFPFECSDEPVAEIMPCLLACRASDRFNACLFALAVDCERSRAGYLCVRADPFVLSVRRLPQASHMSGSASHVLPSHHGILLSEYRARVAMEAVWNVRCKACFQEINVYPQDVNGMDLQD